MARISMQRRDLLGGLGAGTVLFAPLVRQVNAWAAGKATPNFLAFFTPNGHVRSDFGGSGEGTSFTLKSSLAPLEPHKGKLAIVSNLDNPGASSKGSHEDCVRTLTCMPGPGLYEAFGPSIDWVIGNHLNSRPMTLSSSWPGRPNWQSKISWQKEKVFDPHVDSASGMFGEVFANVMPTQSAAEVEKTLRAKKSILDHVVGDINALNARLPGAQRPKLQTHTEAIRQLEKSLTPASVASCSTTSLKAALDAGGTGLQRSLELKIDLIATAFACGARRSASLLAQGASGGINPVGGPGNHHNVSHGEVPDAKNVWKKIDLWYANRFAYLMKKFTDLGIIDNTVTVWATEISEQHSQIGFVMPVAGGGALGMQLGKAYGDKDQISNLWVSCQKAMGLAKDTFGNKSSGGIPGLWKAV